MQLLWLALFMACWLCTSPDLLTRRVHVAEGDAVVCKRRGKHVGAGESRSNVVRGYAFFHPVGLLHTAHVRTNFEISQYNHWKSQGLQPDEMWRFRVVNVHRLGSGVPLSLIDPRSRGAKTLHRFPSDMSAYELLGLAGEGVDSLEHWMPEDCRACVIIPTAFIDAILDNAERSLLLPAFIGDHAWAPTKKVQKELGEDFHDLENFQIQRVYMGLTTRVGKVMKLSH